MSTMTGRLSGLKWAGINDFLFDAAAKCHLNLTINLIDKGLLRSTTYFTVEGSHENLSVFSKAIQETVKEYNS